MSGWSHSVSVSGSIPLIPTEHGFTAVVGPEGNYLGTVNFHGVSADIVDLLSPVSVSYGFGTTFIFKYGD